MSDNNSGDNSGIQNQAWSRWGYDLVCDLINNGHASGTSGNGDLQQLFDYVCGHETCFLEFKATPYIPDQKFSKDNRFGYHEGESNDDYAWNVAKAIIALANTAGGAIILGVSDKGHEPIPEICNKYWHGKLWDKFSSNICDQLIKQNYTLLDEDKKQRKLVTIEKADCEKLKPLCDIRCCHYQNNTIPIILVNAITPHDVIWIKEEDKDLLLVRTRGDVGRTEKLEGRDAWNYAPPPKDSYSPPHGTGTHPSRRYWNNLPTVPKIVGRDDQLAELNGQLLESENVQWICGDAGIGKTAFIQSYIATYCRENFESPFDVAFFVDAQNLTFSESISRLTSYSRQFEDFCGIRFCDGDDNPSTAIFSSDKYLKSQAFKSWALKLIKQLDSYPGPGKILIVFDNVNSPTFLCDMRVNKNIDITQYKHLRFCITSRTQPACDKHISLFPLLNLPEDDALRILEEKRAIGDELKSAKKIVKLCHHNARAICIIANQLESDSKSDPYARKLNELERNGLSFSSSKGIADKELKALLAQPIENLRQKSSDGDKTLHLFALSVWFKQDNIPADGLKDAFSRYLDSSHGPKTPQEFQIEWENCIDNLLHEGIIEQNQDNETYRIESFWRDILLTFPEPFRLWKYAFETIKQGLFTASSTGQADLSKWRDMLIELIILTISQHSNDPERHQNACEIIKWIVSSEKRQDLIRRLAENYGNVAKVSNACDYLFNIAEREYHRNPQDDDSAGSYIFFLSIKKTIAAKWKHDIKTFSRISKKLRTSFSRLKSKTEDQEINFAEELIYDARQNDKFDHYKVIEKDLNHAFKILLEHKDKHIKVLVKSYIDRIRIEQGFKKYRKVRHYLKKLINLTRSRENKIPSDIVRGFCKEQIAYMHLCQIETATPLTRWFHHWRASSRYSWLIDEMSPRSDEQPLYAASRRLLLFKSHYFKAIALLQRGKEERAMKELDIAYNLCDKVFDHKQMFADQEAIIEFNKYRIKAGILRLQNKLEESQIEDVKAKDCYNNLADIENLDFADLNDDYGNTYALLGKYDKAIAYVQDGCNIRTRLLPPTHIKIQNSATRLACLHFIRAIEYGELANNTEIKKLTDPQEDDENHGQITPFSNVIIKRLLTLERFGILSKTMVLKQLRRDEQREECERVRAVIADSQEMLFKQFAST